MNTKKFVLLMLIITMTYVIRIFLDISYIPFMVAIGIWILETIQIKKPIFVKVIIYVFMILYIIHSLYWGYDYKFWAISSLFIFLIGRIINNQIIKEKIEVKNYIYIVFIGILLLICNFITEWLEYKIMNDIWLIELCYFIFLIRLVMTINVKIDNTVLAFVVTGISTSIIILIGILSLFNISKFGKKLDDLYNVITSKSYTYNNISSLEGYIDDELKKIPNSATIYYNQQYHSASSDYQHQYHVILGNIKGYLIVINKKNFTQQFQAIQEKAEMINSIRNIYLKKLYNIYLTDMILTVFSTIGIGIFALKRKSV